MCGICGQYNYKEKKPVDTEVIKVMTNALIHRGPDDEGQYISGQIGLGFRRLSIIDLEGGRQPMTDQEKSVWVVFNGEIYNFNELKKRLEKKGHLFRTRSDTEVILNGYKQWGIDVLNHLNGMFGLAIWDEKKKRLILARDRMGIKLVYYKLKNGSLLFGSEIRSLLAGEHEKPEIDPVALNLFLRYRYTPSPLTIFRGIKKLAPGTCLIVENRSAQIKRWWDFKPTPFDPMPSIEESTEELLDLYSRSVKRHLISDVPIGLLLSGGLDSGLLLALMNQNGDSWRTFTVGYGKTFRDDELQDAGKTARIMNAQNKSVEITREIFEKTLPKIITCLEEPIASSSIVPMYHLCKCVSQNVKVALIGQGPDELLGGYKRHLGVYYGHYWRSLPHPIRFLAKYLLRNIPRNETVRRGLYSLDVPERLKRYQEVFSIMPGETIDQLFYEGILPANPGDTIFECWKDLKSLSEDTDELGGLNFYEVRSSLPDELLMYADKLSMAHGLELRVPYLDHEIVEYVERLSSSFKIRNGRRKLLHRKVCKKYLPKQIIERKKKGFSVKVVDKWFRESVTGNMENIFREESSLIYRFLYPKKVQRLAKEHQYGRFDHHKILFSLVALEECLRSYYRN